jgi:Flp pilus assembly protein TadG
MKNDPTVAISNAMRRLGGRIAQAKHDTSGATASIFAIMLPVLIGFSALAIDVGLWSFKSRQAQGAADQAAFSAAIAGNVGGNAVTEARAITASMGFTHGAGGVTVDVVNPPATGAFAGSTTHWQVTVTQPQSLGLAALFTATAPTVVSRAVAGSGGGGSCVIGLATSGTAITFTNNSQLRQSECGVYSNGNISIGNSNNVLIDADLYSAGTISQGNNAVVTGTQSTGEPIFTNPYAGVTAPAATGACIPQVVNGGNLLPGRYCNGFTLGNSSPNKTVNLAPGIYYIGQRFNVGQNFTFRGTGVTLVFDVPNPSTNVSIGNGNIFDIIAPTSGPLSGIAFMSTTATNPSTFTFGNNNIISVQGAFYFPNSTLVMNNNLDSSRCTQLVALRVTLSNNATMRASCPGSGIRGLGGGTIALVE